MGQTVFTPRDLSILTHFAAPGKRTFGPPIRLVGGPVVTKTCGGIVSRTTLIGAMGHEMAGFLSKIRLLDPPDWRNYNRG